MDKIYKYKKAVEKILFSVNSRNVSFFDPKKGDNLTPNYTINCFFKKHDLRKVDSLINKLQKIDNNQLFYKPKSLHVTLLGQIDINSDNNEIIQLVQNYLSNNKLQFHLLGVGSSIKAASVTGYPINLHLKAFRAKLREIGGGTKYYSPYENLAWLNFMRYLQPPKKELLDALKKEIYTDFGTIEPKEVLLLKNSSRLLRSYEVVHKFSLY